MNKAVSGAINSSIMTMGYHAFGGNGFENNSFSKFNWNSMAYSAQDLGGFLGNKANGWVLNHYGIDKDTGVRTGNRENDSWFDKAASYLHEGAIKIDNGVKGFFNNVGKMVGDGIKSIGKGIASIVDNVWDSLVFNDDEARRINDINISRLMWKTGEMQCLIDVDTVYKYNKNNGNGDPKSHRDYVDYFDAKMRLSKDPTTNKDYKINESDKANLLKTLSQKNNGQLTQEIFDAVKSNIELFEKKSGLKFKDDDAIKTFANRVAHSACVNANLYAQLKFVGSDVEQYYGDFYLKNVERDYLVKDHTGLVMDQAVSYQRIVNNYDVNGNKIDVQYMGYDKTADIFKNEYNQNIFKGKYTKNEVYNSLLELNQSDIVVRFSNRRGNGHNISISNDHLYDTGLANRRWGSDFRNYIRPNNIRSFYWLKVGR